MNFNIDDYIVSFHQKDTIFMYYNAKRQTITLLAVILPYNRRYLWSDDTYIFYDFIRNIKQSEKTCMSYDSMIKNVEFIMNHFKISVPKNIRYCMT